MCFLMEAGLGESFITARNIVLDHVYVQMRNRRGYQEEEHSVIPTCSTDLPYLLVSGLNNRFNVPCWEHENPCIEPDGCASCTVRGYCSLEKKLL